VREAKFKRTSHGCIVKAVKFKALGVRDPLRAELRHTRDKPRHSSAAAVAASEQMTNLHSTAAAVSPPMDPELARATADLGAALERKWTAAEQAQDDAMLASVPRGKPPP
jgi:hypothetical protein